MFLNILAIIPYFQSRKLRNSFLSINNKRVLFVPSEFSGRIWIGDSCKVWNAKLRWKKILKNKKRMTWYRKPIIFWYLVNTKYFNNTFTFILITNRSPNRRYCYLLFYRTLWYSSKTKNRYECTFDFHHYISTANNVFSSERVNECLGHNHRHIRHIRWPRLRL